MNLIPEHTTNLHEMVNSFTGMSLLKDASRITGENIVDCINLAKEDALNQAKKAGCQSYTIVSHAHFSPDPSALVTTFIIMGYKEVKPSAH